MCVLLIYCWNNSPEKKDLRELEYEIKKLKEENKKLKKENAELNAFKQEVETSTSSKLKSILK